MGQLPVHGVGWYRRDLVIGDNIPDDVHYLDVDGGISYSMVWVNNHLVGGWPFGYNSFRLNISPFLKEGSNTLAIRTENPAGHSSRWYPGAGLYPNVWLTTVSSVHVGHWGIKVTSRDVSKDSAAIDLSITAQRFKDSMSGANETQTTVTIISEAFELDYATGQRRPEPVAKLPRQTLNLAGNKTATNSSVIINSPKLWGPPPSQKPCLYEVVTTLYAGRYTQQSMLLNPYETRFGILSVVFDPNKGIIVNGEHVYLQGVNQHHHIGALGAAYNQRAAVRQLETLQEMGSNAIRLPHNPPGPKLLDLTGQMAFLVINEIFHIILRSYGNEVKEQSSDDEGAADDSVYLRDICHQEDPTRLTTSVINLSSPNSYLAQTLELISINYQGEGIRYGPAYEYLTGNKMPQHDAFHEAFPDRVIPSGEYASSLSLRGSFLFPVTPYNSAPVNSTDGDIPNEKGVGAYELCTAQAGSSPDRVFLAQDEHPYVSGGFVWTGWDYIGEPYYHKGTRSGNWGIVDLAGFKKERFWPYQARWRPNFPVAHIVPHWIWPNRTGEITPVHVFSSGDKAELFVNGESKGRRTRESDPGFYRFKWDNVRYEPGEVHVFTCKNGREWANDNVRTTGDAVALQLKADRDRIVADGEDVSFITVEIVDADGNVVLLVNNMISMSVASGLGEIAATDNGHPADFTAFTSKERKAFHDILLAIVKSTGAGNIVITANSPGLKSTSLPLIAI
ncbi:glycosyl hydrolase family 2 [Colletotrichum gloeosporioides Cg-14]|uniref:Glycosyl hydrolase family 2 n=1 Tax=Colletotrichum gloeosporioides (strain Cg-14) TaxID=1237896 RepID=T0K6W5_COLGC|nr:glycosyl hydrolase family 2 [Colletotrichum gloeosporioides Cg-14]